MASLDNDVADDSCSVEQNQDQKKDFYGDAAKYWEVS